jgi:hypothetical protein
VVKGEFKEISLDDYKGKYVVLFFYPLDFTFVCPTEIIAFSDRFGIRHFSVDDTLCDYRTFFKRSKSVLKQFRIRVQRDFLWFSWLCGVFRAVLLFRDFNLGSGFEFFHPGSRVKKIPNSYQRV